MMLEPQIFIIAGPNGAGKTTFALELLPNEARVLQFVNADLIAAGISPFNPESAAWAAGKVMLKQIDNLAERRESFAFETTLSGKIYARKIRNWKASGYSVLLFFLRLKAPETAIERIAYRVAQGGHYVPDDIVRRRFNAGLRNFETIYKYLVDYWAIYDNSDFMEAGVGPILVEEGYND